MTVTKEVLVKQVSEGLGEDTSKWTISAVVNALFDAMGQHLVKGNRIEVRGFGSFTVKEMKARPRARNPRTGKLIQIPSRPKIHFKPGQLIKAALRAQRMETGEK